MTPTFPEPIQIKIYTAILTQTGTNAPVATILHNTLGNIIWTRTSAGIYLATTSSSLSTINKFGGYAMANACFQRIDWSTETTAILQTLNAATNTLEDGLLFNSFIEIRVYN